MKKLFITGLMVAMVPCAYVQAEVIQTINFNPARLGQYERLKVSEKATFQGGLTAQSMQVRSAGTVSINESESDALAYDIPLLDGRKGKNDGAAVLSTFPATPTLDFGGACFSSLENCVSSSSTGNLNVKFNGGAARFVGPSGYNDPASRINQITTNANQLRLESVYATVKGKLNITGVGAFSYRNLGNPSTPLRLAGNWVPLPSTDGVDSNQLLWETRKTVKHPDKGGESVKILVLAGTGKIQPDNIPPSCPSQPCPNGQQGSIYYSWNATSKKCVESYRTCVLKPSPAPEVATYSYKLTYTAPTVVPGLKCETTCGVGITDIGKPITPSDLYPKCTEANVGFVCKIGRAEVTMSGKTGERCLQYTCTKD